MVDAPAAPTGRSYVYIIPHLFELRIDERCCATNTPMTSIILGRRPESDWISEKHLLQ